MSRRAGLLAVALAVAVAPGCVGGQEGEDSARRGTEPAVSPPEIVEPPRVERYEPIADEEFANGKRLAGRIAQRALTYRPGQSARQVAAALPPSSTGTRRLGRVLAPAVEAERWSVAEVVYPQLSGVTDTTFGAMVVTRQITGSEEGEQRSLTRVVDVRLRLSEGEWTFDTIGSVGGRPVDPPGEPSAAAREVLDNRNIVLPDSARWDILRGGVDDGLLGALADAAARRRLSVAVVRSGHPRHVWATSRPSAHSSGAAVDIYAVDGRPVIAQRAPGTPAYELAAELYERGAYQLGSPWVFGVGGVRSFTDPVHQDHIHLQQSPL